MIDDDDGDDDDGEDGVVSTGWLRKTRTHSC
jgi:hypothetical protein